MGHLHTAPACSTAPCCEARLRKAGSSPMAGSCVRSALSYEHRPRNISSWPANENRRQPRFSLSFAPPLLHITLHHTYYTFNPRTLPRSEPRFATPTPRSSIPPTFSHSRQRLMISVFCLLLLCCSHVISHVISHVLPLCSLSALSAEFSHPAKLIGSRYPVSTQGLTLS